MIGEPVAAPDLRQSGCLSSTFVRVTREPDDIAALRGRVDSLVTDLARASRIEIYRGGSHETYPPRRDDEPLMVLDDPEVVGLVREVLAGCEFTPKTVVPVLAGLRLVWMDDDEFRDSVDLLSPRWVRYSWPYDAITSRSVLPLEALEQLGPDVWPANLHKALDAVEPSIPAASRPDTPDNEHAQPGSDALTLCGIPGRDVVLYRHHFAAADGDCARCRELVWAYEPAFPRRARHEQSREAQRFSEMWQRQWPERRAISYELRGHGRWVRFHSLPDSKRYADTESEYLELLRRHRAVLTELAGSGHTGEVFVVTASYSGGTTPTPRAAPLCATFPNAVWWESHCTDDDPDFPSWTHLWLDRCPLSDPRLDTLLRIVADDQARDVLLVDPDVRWVYHPYDGGGDVHASTQEQRDELKARYAPWLPSNAAGL